MGSEVSRRHKGNLLRGGGTLPSAGPDLIPSLFGFQLTNLNGSTFIQNCHHAPDSLDQLYTFVIRENERQLYSQGLVLAGVH